MNTTNNEDISIKYKPDDKVVLYSTSGIETNSVSGTELNWKVSDDSTISEKVNKVVTVFDVAAYILKKQGKMSTMKLQKLVYYSQAWSLVWDECPLYNESIEAWANGPVIKELFDFHRGFFSIDSITIGNPDNLNKNQKDTIDKVLDVYGEKKAQWLIDLTHLEDPWKEARKGLNVNERSSREIKQDSIAMYYSSL